MRSTLILLICCSFICLAATVQRSFSPFEPLLSFGNADPAASIDRDWQLNRTTNYNWENTWNPNTRNLYTYRYDGQTDEILTQNYAAPNWQDSGKSVYSYDAQDSNTMITHYLPEGGAWSPSGKTEMTYQDALLLNQDSFLRQNNTWQLSARMTYTYLADRISTLDYYTMTEGALLHTMHQDYEYDEEDRLSVIYLSYIAYPQISDMRMMYSYNTEGYVSELLYQQEQQAGVWMDYNRYIYSYDALGELSQILTQSYTGNWINTARQIYSYPDGYSIREMIYQNWDLGAWANQSKSVDERSTVAISEQLSPTPESSLSLYPNPMSAGLWIEDKSASLSGSGMDIYNLKGQKIRSFTPRSAKTFWDAKDSQGREVPAGIYILKHGERHYRLLKF
jgi:hypothetical protein